MTRTNFLPPAFDFGRRNDTMDDKIKAKIRKLLTLSQNNPSAEEAAVAFGMAQTMATRHGLGLDDIDKVSPDAPDEIVGEIKKRNIAPWDKAVPWKMHLVQALAMANGCKAYTSPGRGGGAHAYGQEKGLDAVEYLYAAIAHQVNAMASAAVQAYKNDPETDARWGGSPRAFGNAFRMGAVHKIYQRMKSQLKVLQEEQEKIAKALPGMKKSGWETRPESVKPPMAALAVLDRKADFLERLRDEVQTYGKRKLGLRSTGRSYTSGQRSNGGYQAGRAAGGGINLGGNKALS